MTVRCFVDTSVLTYARDPNEAAKRPVAEAWITECARRGALVTNPQVVSELHASLIRRARSDEARADAHVFARGFLRWCTAPVDGEVVSRAFELHTRRAAPWWDALVIASAQAAGCRFLLSEDVGHGQKYGDLVVLDPFQTQIEDVFGEPLRAAS